MGIVRSFIPLLIILVAILFSFLPSPPIAAAGEPNPPTCNNNTLLTSVCGNVSNTTGFAFCCGTFNESLIYIYTKIDVAYTAFIQAHVMASDIQDQILNNNREKKESNCYNSYNQIMKIDDEVLQNLDYYTVNKLNEMITQMQYKARNCDNSLNPDSVIWKQKGIMLKYLDICSAVAQLNPFNK